MSELVREVVAEVMARTGRTGGSAALTRPNYQRQKAEERRRQLLGEGRPGPKGGDVEQELATRLRRTCLSHVCGEAVEPPRPAVGAPAAASRVRGEGQDRAVCLWQDGAKSLVLIPAIAEQAIPRGKASYLNKLPAAVLALPQPEPHELIALAEAVKGAALEVAVFGTIGSGLEVVLHHVDLSVLRLALRPLESGLRLGKGRQDPLTAPPAFLRNLFGLGQVEALAMIRRGNPWTLAVVADELRRHGQGGPEVLVQDGILLLHGREEEVRAGLEQAWASLRRMGLWR